MDFRSKALIIVALTVFIDSFIYGIIVPVLPVYIRNLGASALELGIIFAVYSLALLIASIPIGLLADRFGRKKIMALGMVVLTLSTVGFAYANTFLSLTALRFLQGAAAAATWTAGPAFVADLYPPEVRGEKMGLAMAGMNFGFMVGPAVGGFIYDWGGYSMPFLLASILAAIVSVLVMAVLKEPAVKETMRSQLTWQDVAHSRVILTTFILVLLASMGFGFLDPLLPGYFHDKFGASSTVIGLLFGAISVTSIVAQPLFGMLSDKYGRVPIIQFGIVITALVTPLLTAVPTIVSTALVMGGLGLAFGLMFAPSGPLLADAVMKGHQYASYGAAFGIYNTAYSLGYLIGPLFGGAWVDIWNLESLLICYSLGLLLFFPVFSSIKKATGNKRQVS